MFDIGVNLTSSQFAKDATQVVERAKTAGVTGILITGTNAQQSEAASHLARAHSGYCWSTAGVHPHDASSWNDEVAQHIHRLASQPFVAAIGECGLDFNRNFSTRHSRNWLSPLNWHWPPSSLCRSSCIAATHTHVLLHC